MRCASDLASESIRSRREDPLIVEKGIVEKDNHKRSRFSTIILRFLTEQQVGASPHREQTANRLDPHWTKSLGRVGCHPPNSGDKGVFASGQRQSREAYALPWAWLDALSDRALRDGSVAGVIGSRPWVRLNLLSQSLVDNSFRQEVAGREQHTRDEESEGDRSCE